MRSKKRSRACSLDLHRPSSAFLKYRLSYARFAPLFLKWRGDAPSQQKSVGARAGAQCPVGPTRTAAPPLGLRRHPRCGGCPERPSRSGRYRCSRHSDALSHRFLCHKSGRNSRAHRYGAHAATSHRDTGGCIAEFGRRHRVPRTGRLSTAAHRGEVLSRWRVGSAGPLEFAIRLCPIDDCSHPRTRIAVALEGSAHLVALSAHDAAADARVWRGKPMGD